MKSELGRVQLSAIGIAGLALAAAGTPSVLSQVAAGEWQISRAGHPTVRLCVADPGMLAQFEHRGGNCTRMVVRHTASAATISYSCSGGGFGRSDVTLLTPRSLRIETQGISANAPFNYTIQARRVGDCPAH